MFIYYEYVYLLFKYFVFCYFVENNLFNYIRNLLNFIGNINLKIYV